MIDILVLNYNDSETTIQFANLVKQYSCISHILVVDNCSTDESFKKLKSVESDKVIVISSDKNGGYGYGNNFGIRYLKNNFDSNYILLSNPDVIVSEDAIVALESFLRNHPDYVIAAPFMHNVQNVRQSNTAQRIPSKFGFILSQSIVLSQFFHYRCYNFNQYDLCKNYIDVDCVSGSCFMFDVKKMMNYGMFDENIFLYKEELVLGIKFKEAKQKVALLTESFFIHKHSVSISKAYKTVLSKRKLSLKSHLFVLKKYYKANRFEMWMASIVAKISMFEVLLLSLLKK